MKNIPELWAAEVKISLTVQILTPLINSCDIRKFERCIAKFKLSLTTTLFIVANFGRINWIDWPFARRTARYVFCCKGSGSSGSAGLLQRRPLTTAICCKRPGSSGPAGLLLGGQVATALCCKWSGSFRMCRQYKKKQKSQSSDTDSCNLTVFKCVYILSVRTESGIKRNTICVSKCISLIPVACILKVAECT